MRRRIDEVDILDQRSIRRHALGAQDFTGNLVGAQILDVVRRGKFLWLPLAVSANSSHPDARDSSDAPPVALMAHLGMSGQLLVKDAGSAEEKHLRVRLTLSVAESADGPLPRELRFVDQRIFGGLFVTSMIATNDGSPGGLGESPVPLIPVEAAHIARDPLDPAFSFDSFYTKLRRRKTGIKRALLDQSLVSGIGNIYADEALWAAKIHFARPTDTMRRADALRLLGASRKVMMRALDAGGTSFDSLYVNVNGTSGYFERSLQAYGREGKPCTRCAEDLGFAGVSLIRRDIFMNRSSFSCPRCQPTPRKGRW